MEKLFYSCFFGLFLFLVAETGWAVSPCTVAGLLAARASESQIASQPAKPLPTLFEEVRALFLSEIASLNLESKPKELLRKRLLTIQFKTRNCSGSGSARASYFRNQHKIEICEASLNLPEAAQVVLLSHEMGHSMDLCSIGSGFYEVFPGAKQIVFKPTLDHDTAISVDEVMRPETKFLVDSALLANPRGKEILDALIASSKIKKVESGILEDKNPIKNVYRCLAASSGYPALPARAEVCNGTAFTEAGAQIWATKVTARYINANLFHLTGADLYGMFSNVNIVRKAGNQDPSGKEKDYNEMFLKEKSIRSAFACADPPLNSCF